MSMRKQVPLHLEVTPQQLELLDSLKRETGAPRNEIIRRAIDAYLREQDKKQGRGTGTRANRD